jgi:hypothetical protein
MVYKCAIVSLRRAINMKKIVENIKKNIIKNTIIHAFYAFIVIYVTYVKNMNLLAVMNHKYHAHKDRLDPSAYKDQLDHKDLQVL